ncbi:29032_t:CDS:2, partial [Gigaspora margarita]
MSTPPPVCTYKIMSNVIENRYFSKTEKNVQQKKVGHDVLSILGLAVAGIAEHRKLEERSTTETVGHEELSFQIFYIDSGSEISSTNFDPVIQKGEMEIECVHIEK